MATLLTGLSDDDRASIGRLTGKIREAERQMERLDRYYEGSQRLEHIGLAVPPELRHFETVVNIPGMAVDEPRLRQAIRAFYRSGDSTTADPALREAWEFNNLGSESAILHQEEKVFGHSYVSVGTNPDDEEHPLIAVEDPRQIGCSIDVQRRQIREAFRLYRDDDAKTTRGTLYQRAATVHVIRGRNGWQIADMDGAVDEHDLGVVPLVMFTNRRRGGSWRGRSEMQDVMGMTDGIARLITNMQVGAESHALPSWFISGASAKDFQDQDGNPVPVWESYMAAIKAITNENAKVQQFQAGDLKNFTEAVNSLFSYCAAVLGLPTRYAGQQTVNPAAEGAIRADESRLVARVQDKNRFDGDSWAWVMGLEEKFRTGEWGDRNSIRTDWFDPGTSTRAQLSDSLVKLRSVNGISIEGMWDELGWDQARKDQERARLDAELASDPLVVATRALQVPSGTPAGA